MENNRRKLHVVTAYRPCYKQYRKLTKKGRLGQTVWEQHVRFYKEVEGIKEPQPRALFDEYLFGSIKKWRSKGEEIVLVIDANEDVYKGPFAEHLASIGVDMTCAYQKVHKQKMPSSHQSGSLPIMGIFVTPGITCEHSFIARYGCSVGDHRGPHYLDIWLKSVLGTNDPPLRLLGGQKLQVKAAPRIMKKYNADLNDVTDRHRMLKKSKKLTKQVKRVEDLPDTSLEKAAVQIKLDKYDDEYREMQLGCEDCCRKIRVGELEYCQDVRVLVKRRNVINWLINYHEKKLAGGTNKMKKKKLRQICIAMKLPAPG